MSFQPSSKNRAWQGIRAMIVAIFVNMLLAVVKIITGVLGHSYALIADGIESTADIFSSTVVLGGLTIGSIPPDANHPYGHGKAEPLAAMVVSLVLVGIAGGIAIQSLKEIMTPHYMPSPFTLIVLVGVVITKEILFHFVFKAGKSIDSLSLKVDAWHQRSDALTSLAAFAGISIALIGGEGYQGADDWAALFASGVIAFNGMRLFNDAIAEIMDAVPAPELEDKIRAVASGLKDVAAVEKCRVRKSGLDFFVEIHIEVDGHISVRRGHEIAHNVKNTLMNSSLGVTDCVIHVEPS